MACAAYTSLKVIPKPSLPNAIPTAKNKSKAGTPRRYPALSARILTKNKIDMVSRINSICIVQFVLLIRKVSKKE